MIPDRVAEVIEGPSPMQVGTRDAKLRPHHAYVGGAVVHDDRRTVTFLVTERRAKEILKNLADNGRVALTAAQVSHEAYQLKGSYLSSRPATAEDDKIAEAYRDNLWPSLAQVWPEEVVKPLVLGVVYRPAVAITFRVEEIFLQTPGPRAGEKLA